jgi:hypothetical protein
MAVAQRIRLLVAVAALAATATALPRAVHAQGINALTNSQFQALKTIVDGDPALSVIPNTPDGNIEVAAALNQPATPDYWVLRTFVADTEIYEKATADGTSWSWPIYIARSVAERAAWDLMVRTKGGINPSLASVRTAVADIFSGAGGAAQRAHLLVVSRRRATRAERAFAAATVGGAGTRGSTANPDTMTFEGDLQWPLVQAARNLP